MGISRSLHSSGDTWQPWLALNIGLTFRCLPIPAYRKIYDCDSAMTDGFPIKYYTRSLGFWVKVFDAVFKEIRDGSALGNRKLKASSQKYLLGTLKDRSCLEKSHDLRVNHSKKREMIATRCRSCSGRAD